MVVGCRDKVVRKKDIIIEKEDTKKNSWKGKQGKNRKDIHRNTHTELYILRGRNTIRGKERERCPRSKTILS